MHALEEFPQHRHRLCVEDFHKMVEAGVFTPDDRVELMEGELVDMAPIRSPRSGMVYKLIYLISSSIHGKAIVGAQNPLILGDRSEVQPDLLILKPRADLMRIRSRKISSF